jgi:hypothetical protein
MFGDKKRKEHFEISFKLNDYNDIFSSFDSRNYDKKALSDDFLSELKRAAQDKDSIDELKLTISPKKRNEHETEIKKRLKDHFIKHLNILTKEYKSVISEGIIFILIGLVLMFVATFILFYYTEKNLFMTFLVIILEPGGWFLFWEGLDLIIFNSKEIRKTNLEFYRKMSEVRITFLSH